MIPNITIGSRTISAYMICTLIGIFIAGFAAVRNTDKKESLELITVLLWSAPGVVFGGHLLYALTNLNSIFAAIRQGEGFLTVLNYLGGNVFYGGLIGGILSAVVYCKFAHIDYLQYGNDAAIFIPLFHFFGRVGCFLSGCCYGIESEIGFVYEYSPIESANHVRRFPIQLVEALGNLVIFLILFILYKNKRFDKKLLPMYFMMYSLLRFAVEFFRGDSYRGFILSISTSQFISIFVFIIGVITWFIDPGQIAGKTERRHEV